MMFKGPPSPKMSCVHLLLFTNVSIVQSYDLIGFPEYSRWCENLCIFNINQKRQIGLIGFSSVALIYLNIFAPTNDIYSPKH